MPARSTCARSCPRPADDVVAVGLLDCEGKGNAHEQGVEGVVEGGPDVSVDVVPKADDRPRVTVGGRPQEGARGAGLGPGDAMAHKLNAGAAIAAAAQDGPPPTPTQQERLADPVAARDDVRAFDEVVADRPFGKASQLRIVDVTSKVLHV